MITIPVYVVNLERKPLLKKGFKDHNKIFSDIRFTKAFDSTKEKLPPHKQSKDGRFGCYMSHIKIWKKIINRKDDWVIVAEDDAAFNPKLEKDLPKIIELMKKNKSNIGIINWRKARAGLYEVDIPLPGVSNEIKLAPVNDVFFGTHSYIINKQGAKDSIALHKPKEKVPIDLAMGMLSKTKQLPAHFILSPYEYARIWPTNQISTTEEKSIGEKIKKNNKSVYIGIILIILLLIFITFIVIKKNKK